MLRATRPYPKWLLVIPLFFLLAGILPREAQASLTIEDEKKLGKEFYEKLEKGHFLSEDQRANEYLTRLGEQILAHSDDKASFPFTFSIIRSAAINAFATPGGYVYVNRGLINLVENEAELAGVLAHEIAHVNGHDIAELTDRSQKISLSTLAAVLAGAFLGGGGDLSAAVTSFSVAAATTLSLKYSREQEESADRMGLSYLVAAGYDGRMVLNFLKIMRRYEYFSDTVPSYFLTHPGTDERTRYIDALLQSTDHPPGADEIIGGLRRVQVLLLLDAKSSNDNLNTFMKMLKENPDDTDALYGLAVTQEKLGMVEESLVYFRKAIRLAPDDVDIVRSLGIDLFKLGRSDEARGYLLRATELRPDDPDARLFLGKTLLALGESQKALGLFKALEEERPDDPDNLYNLATAFGKAGKEGESHYYFGLYFKKKGKSESALFHFQAARKALPESDPKSEVIRKEIDALSRR